MVFLAILASFPILDALWWRWADRRLKRLPYARKWRTALAALVGTELLFYLWWLLSRTIGLPMLLPKPLLISLYVWHMLVLPGTLLAVGCGTLLDAAIARLRRRMNRPAPIVLSGPTRRDILIGAAVAIPPLLTIGTVGAAMATLDKFRIRRLEVKIPSLPPALEGLTIAHVSDTHIGRFTTGRMLEAIVERTNALKPDLIMMTGDLIDFQLADLPAGLEMARGFRSRYGLFLCEGNHDLFEDRWEFEHRVKNAGLRLLVNQDHTIHIGGQPVQVLGLKWGGDARTRDGRMDEHMREILKLRRPEAFPILLAHHPHSFDAAVESGLPLTLAGHTHGGQVMLTPNIGPGPLLYKYWSGLYQRGNSSLVVSNGTGNWFPLRINAPAEIVHITLRSISAAAT